MVSRPRDLARHKPLSIARAAPALLTLVLLAGCRDAKHVAPQVVEAQQPTHYVAETTCAKCHAAHTEGYRSSAHALTSSWPTPENMNGHFEAPENRMTTIDPNVSFVMERENGGYFQTALVTTPAQTLQRKERMDVIIGSGRKGQTYLYWHADQLFELPVSLWTQTKEWMNSPGYPDGSANFERGSSNRCLECHATSFHSLAPPRNRFERGSLTLGISCQKCHGPAGAHVARFEQNPTATGGPTDIVNPAKLSRERQMDLCSLCHAGLGKSLTPPLSYIAGDVLAKHLALSTPSPETQLDPHGSQAQALLLSRCFQSSQTMTCTTCHDVHQTQRSVSALSANCVACHTPEKCGRFKTLGPAITQSCVTCHMPLETTEKIVMRINGRRVQPQVRNHRIGIYPGH